MLSRSVALASLAIVVANVSVNLGAALGKSLFPAIGPEGVAALRTSLSAIILLTVARPWTIRVTRGQARWLLLYGLAIGGMNLMIYWAIERIPLGVAVTIEISGPLAVVLLTSRSARDFLWLALAVIGLLLLVPWPGSHAPLDPLGMVFALGAAVCWGLYIVFGKQASQVESRAAVGLGMAFACLLTVPFGLAAAGPDLLLPNVLTLGLLVAVLSSAFPYLLEMKAFERLSNRVFGVVTSSAPATAALVGVVVLGERLSPLQWLAVGLLIAASAGGSLARRPSIEPASKEVLY